MKKGATSKQYVDPEHPVYVVQGTSGAYMKTKWVKPTPEWSAKKLSKFGYGRITVKGKQELRYQFVEAPTGVVIDDWKIVRKGQKGDDKIVME